MNPLLAQIYGTGFDKTASEGTIDLDSISGADLLAGLESGEIVLDGMDKEAGDEIDLSQLSGSELLALMEDLDDDGYDEDVLNKMASDGSAEYWDMAGRIMAHAYADEMSKVAGYDSDVIDLDDIDGETMMALLESGEYELVKEGGTKELRALREALRGEAKRLGLRGTAAQNYVSRGLKANVKNTMRASTALPPGRKRTKADVIPDAEAYLYTRKGTTGGGNYSLKRRATNWGTAAGMQSRSAWDWAKKNKGKAALGAGLTAGIPAAAMAGGYYSGRKRR